MNIIGSTSINAGYRSKKLSNLELAKQDLSNHFAIRKGEKWTNPTFGSNLPFLVFQPLDKATIEEINDDVRTIVSYDPRFQLTSEIVQVNEDQNYITVLIELLYLPTKTATDLRLKFDKEFNEDLL